jgi:membrane glycosyltransferase
LVLSIPLSIWSRTSAGDWARKHALFLIPEELEPPDVLQRLHQQLAIAPSRPWAQLQDGLARVLEDTSAYAAHLSLLPRPTQSPDPLHEHHLRGLELKFHYHGLQALTRKEKREILLNRDSIHRLRTNAHQQLEAAG